MSRVIVPLEQNSELEDPESHVVLPVVSISDAPHRALTVMRHNNRAAVVATSEDRIVLLTAADIVVGKESGASTLGAINPTAVFRPNPDSNSRFFEIFNGPTERSSAFLLQFGGNQARLITGNTRLSLKYGGGLRDVYCDGPGQHDTFPPPPPSAGDRCPFGDGYIVST
jgi:hypothetical protein